MTLSTAAYRYALLKPGSKPEADTFGIEMTIPEMAAGCIANLDPQHGADRAGDVSAIEAACNIALPRPGTTLATIRPDADAVGAMAVMAWRAAGLPLRTEIRERVELVGRMDRHDRGPWPGRRDLEEVGLNWPGAELASISAMCFDSSLSLLQRVVQMSRWLTTGELPAEHFAASQQHAGSLYKSIAEGRTTTSLAAPGLAVVRSDVRGALELGYCIAPIVIATNPFFCFCGGDRGRKHTVATWEGRGLERFRDIVSDYEPGWGGAAGIVGSPQTQPSRLSSTELVDLVKSAFAKDHS